ncbi:hypothetical protein RRG08_013536 [Elysia crispata]|uniref:Uncharacterized protein n=1 Tax=Elysia crispata TaxID=231223 RepID=A0AAE1CQH8_9GAST|nr:hypothetical protein RRG08_013536 [Elysia crispata]
MCGVENSDVISLFVLYQMEDSIPLANSATPVYRDITKRVDTVTYTQTQTHSVLPAHNVGSLSWWPVALCVQSARYGVYLYMYRLQLRQAPVACELRVAEVNLRALQSRLWSLQPGLGRTVDLDLDLILNPALIYRNKNCWIPGSNGVLAWYITSVVDS